MVSKSSNPNHKIRLASYENRATSSNNASSATNKEKRLVNLSIANEFSSRQFHMQSNPSMHDQANPEYANFREGGLANLTKMEIMFSNTFTIGEQSWDPYALEVNENRGRKREREDEAGEKEENIEVIRNIVDMMTVGFRILEVDNVDSVEQDSNKTKKASSSKEGNEKPTKMTKSKVATTAGMQSQLDRMVEAAESFVPHFTTIFVSNDLPSCSIVEFMSLLKTLPSVELGSKLYMLGARLFIKRQYREMFITLEDDGVRVAWLEDELELIKEGKCTFRR
ncbi:hypothetical protein Cgig2_023449 [Carnegiea gigantea]|uniref:Uncharacterized protein n=1 Tax=Carnegiea gigantea TaxID=171969 RepID=A0A9Q1GPI7_9CARY|nr:hypothetical protein Cgig2_023449 [Carnegiea gigantea]